MRSRKVKIWNKSWEDTSSLDDNEANSGISDEYESLMVEKKMKSTKLNIYNNQRKILEKRFLRNACALEK